MKLIKKFANDIVCTVEANPLHYLQDAISLHENLQFTLEPPNFSGDLAYLDLNTNVNDDRKIICSWYQKFFNARMILSFRSCAP